MKKTRSPRLRKGPFVGYTLLVLFFLWMWETLATPLFPSATHPVQLYATETREDLQLTFAQAIGEAKESVYLTIYSLNDRKIIGALQNAAERGVYVHVVCDPSGSTDAATFLGSGIHTFYRKSKGLMHQKILVIDSTLLWIGSANMTRTSLKQHGNLVIGIYHPQMACLAIEKARAMSEEGKVRLFPPQTFPLDEQTAELWFFPDSPDGVEKIKQMIRAAKKSIKVAMFTWTRFDLADEIIAAHKKGLRVEVILDRYSAQGVSQPSAKRLKKGGVSVRISQGQELLHHKMMLVDDTLLVNGSANWTKAAFTQNDDCFMILQPLNEEQIAHLHQLWEEMVGNSKKL